MNNKIIAVEKGKLIIFPREGRICHCLSGKTTKSWSEIVEGDNVLIPTQTIEYNLLLEMINNFIKEKNIKEDYNIYKRAENDIDGGQYGAVIFE